MRRQGGHYRGDSGGRGDDGGRSAYGVSAAQTHQQHNGKSGYYQGLHQEQQTIGEKERGPQHDNQWRWERDCAQDKLVQTAMSPTAPFSEGREAPRSYYQSQRLELDPRMSMERQGGGDPRSHPHEEDMDIGYEDNLAIHSFEGLEQRFLDDIMKMSKEQTDAEDAENARHRERINAINAQYEEQFIGLRAQHASRRDEVLRRESQARKQQYQQMVLEPYATNNIGTSDPRGFNPAPASGGEPRLPYDDPESYNSYREGNQFPGSARDHGYESKAPYPKGRAYDSSSHYY